MARRHEAARLLRRANSPSKISREMGIGVKTLLQSLCIAAGEGLLRRSDIEFSLDPALRKKGELEARGGSQSKIMRLARKGLGSNDPEKEDVGVYLYFQDARMV